MKEKQIKTKLYRFEVFQIEKLYCLQLIGSMLY